MGSVVYISTTETQHQMGAVMTREGWDGKMKLSATARDQIEWVVNNIRQFNARGSREESGQETVNDTDIMRQFSAGSQVGKRSMTTQEAATVLRSRQDTRN
jgi:hypothetical protein